LCAVIHSVAFFRWLKFSEEKKRNEWRLQGWFTCLSCVGSVVGAAAYGCRLRQLQQLFIYNRLGETASARLDELELIRADSRRFTAAHFALFPIELGIVITTQLLVLCRLQHFVLNKSSRPELWEKARHFLIVVVVLLNTTGLCSNFGAAYYYNLAAQMSDEASTSFSANSTAAGKKFRAQANEMHSHAGSVASIQRFAEVSALLLIIAAFFVVSFFGIQIIASALRTLLLAQRSLVAVSGLSLEYSRQLAASQQRLVASAAHQGRNLRLKVVGTTVFVFCALLLRSFFTILYAVAQSLQNNGDPCAASWCSTCKNVFSNIHGWILYTPVFQNFIMLIASPIALIVSLWGMSDVQSLEQMSSSQANADVSRVASRQKSKNQSDRNLELSMSESLYRSRSNIHDDL
jgi:hypothetical protein